MSVSTCRTQFTIWQLLIVIAILGVLLGLVVIQVQEARKEVERGVCQHNIFQFSYGTLNHQDQRGDQPPLAMFDGGLSWAVLLRPYMERRLDRICYDQPYDDPINRGELRDDDQNYVMLCPIRRDVPQLTGGLPCGDFAVPSLGVVASNDPALDDTWLQAHDPEKNLGPFLVLHREQPQAWRDQPGKYAAAATAYRSQTSVASWMAGSSYQIILGEKAMHPAQRRQDGKGGDFTVCAWMEKDYNASGCTRNAHEPIARTPRGDIDRMWTQFGSWHDGVCMFAYGDGRIQPINNYTSADMLRRYCNRTRADRQLWPESGCDSRP